MRAPAHIRPAIVIRWRAILWLTIAALLALPAVAMLFTTQMNWDAADFAAAAILLIGGGLLFELALHAIHRPAHRIAIGIAILLAIATIWAEAAVGIV